MDDIWRGRRRRLTRIKRKPAPRPFRQGISPRRRSVKRKPAPRKNHVRGILYLVLLGVIGYIAIGKISPDRVLPLVPQSLQGVAINQGHSIQGKPSISVDKINRILCDAGSPACGKGQGLYDDGVAVGINPAYALAFFQHESSFGMAGVARFSHSLGNMRCLQDVECKGGYAYFTTWEQGFQAWYNLINGLYIDQWHLTTIEQIIPRYAPAADNNDEQVYIASVISAVQSWS